MRNYDSKPPLRKKNPLEIVYLFDDRKAKEIAFGAELATDVTSAVVYLYPMSRLVRRVFLFFYLYVGKQGKDAKAERLNYVTRFLRFLKMRVESDVQ